MHAKFKTRCRVCGQSVRRRNLLGFAWPAEHGAPCGAVCYGSSFVTKLAAYMRGMHVGPDDCKTCVRRDLRRSDRRAERARQAG